MERERKNFFPRISFSLHPNIKHLPLLGLISKYTSWLKLKVINKDQLLFTPDGRDESTTGHVEIRYVCMCKDTHHRILNYVVIVR